MEWLLKLTNWLAALISGLWSDFTEFLHDWGLNLLEMLTDFAVEVVNGLPVPDFLDGLSLCGYLNAAGPIVGWAMGAMHIPEGMALIGGAIVFRMLRKLLTLFQW